MSVVTPALLMPGCLVSSGEAVPHRLLAEEVKHIWTEYDTQVIYYKNKITSFEGHLIQPIIQSLFVNS